MMSNDRGLQPLSKQIDSLILRVALMAVFFGLAVAAGAMPSIIPHFDLIPALQPAVVNQGDPTSGIEADIRVSPVEFGNKLPIPKLPLKGSRRVLTSQNMGKPQLGADGLPLPWVHFDPATLSPARNVQVQAAPAKDKARVPTATSASSTIAAGSVRPAATAAPKTAPTSVKTPVPLQRRTQPTKLAQATATPSPQTSASRLLVIASPSPRPTSAPPVTAASAAREMAALAVDDPHALPEYALVQLPDPSPVPAPAQSLAAKAQDLDGLQGQALSIKLAGRGWIYTGTGKTPAGVSYIEKSVQTDSEQFRFRLDETGRVVLQFQRQDVASGLLDREDVAVTVKSRLPVSNNNGMRVQATSANMGGIGSYEPEYPVPQESVSRPRVASVAAKPDRDPAANAAPATAAAVEAAFNPASLPNDASKLLSAALQREQLHQSGNARLVYEKILKDFSAYDKTDEVLFRLAKILESAPEGRDIRRAYEIYVRIQDEFPYSIWVDSAKDRARFLKRTFFQQ